MDHLRQSVFLKVASQEKQGVEGRMFFDLMGILARRGENRQRGNYDALKIIFWYSAEQLRWASSDGS